MTTEDKLKRLKQTGVIDGLGGAKEVGMLLDMHNQGVKKKREKELGDEINARNLYFYKLWVRAIESARSGEKPRPPRTNESKIHL